MAEMIEKKVALARIKKILDKYSKIYEHSRIRSIDLIKTSEAKMEVAQEIFDEIAKIEAKKEVPKEQKQEEEKPQDIPNIPKPTFNPNSPENRRKEQRR